MRKKDCFKAPQPIGDEVLNLQLAGKHEQQFLRAQQALFVADAACLQAVKVVVRHRHHLASLSLIRVHFSCTKNTKPARCT